VKQKIERNVETFVAKMETRNIEEEFIHRFTQVVATHPDVPIARMFWPTGMTRN
jgi:hypothetical protein